MIKHGFSGTPTYVSWHAMFCRCYKSYTNGFHNYGGRGITVCERWRNIVNFVEDMGLRPIGHVLDRKNVDGNYEPDNCRWVNHRESSRNKRNTVIPYISGEPDNIRRQKINRAWCKAHPERRSESKHEYYLRYKSRLLDKAKRYYAANRMKAILSARAYRLRIKLESEKPLLEAAKLTH